MDNFRIQRICREAVDTLAMICREHPVLRDALKPLNAQTVSCENMNRFTGGIPAHEKLLRSAISEIPGNPFAKLKSALRAACEQLCWRVDDGHFYAESAEVGEGYKSGNMHALLAGPEDCPILAKDFLMGFFLLAPRTLYRDHRHLAPEVYVPLTGPSGWRFEQGAWRDYEPGSMINNAPEIVHATRVYDTPFLSLFVWSQDIDAACEVVFADDWRMIEAELAT